jgi:hypothetical protein
VLPYDNEELIFLCARNQYTGSHIENTELETFGVRLAPKTPFQSLEEIQSAILTLEDAEGFVARFETQDGDDLFVKFKCDWYCVRHRLLTDTSNEPHNIAAIILEGKMDDVLSNIPLDLVDLIDKFKRCWEIINAEVKLIAGEIKAFHDVYVEVGDKKTFALAYNKHKYFFQVMSHVNRGEDFAALAATIIGKQTQTYKIALAWFAQRDDTLFGKFPD